MTILLALLGGFFYRVRGGFLDPYIGLALGKGTSYEAPNHALRLTWAIFVIAMLYSHIPLDYLPASLIAAFIGVVPGYFGGQFDLSKAENRKAKNYAMLTLRGMFIMFPLALVTLPLNLPQVWYAVFAGSLFVPSYLVGNLLYKVSKIQGHTQYGEWLIGICITGALLYESILMFLV